MTRVGVIAHAGKTLGGGLPDLRAELARRGVIDPLWREVQKSRKAPKQVRRLIADGAELIVAWGGDGLVQRCIDAMAGSEAVVAIIPAGTANLLASNLGIPKDIPAAVEIGLAGERRRLDVGRVNGERFAVMAGAGFDARMIADTGGTMKGRLGRLAYVWTGARHLRDERFKARIAVDGAEWYRGRASCILLGNVGKVFGGLEAFADARPDDGRLELGVVTAEGITQWARTLAHAVAGNAAGSPFAEATKARSVRIRLDRKLRYELDGGARKQARSLDVEVEPGAVTVCAPATNGSNGLHA
jgi:YegS/Rv2252/BmrU family lipid kinase